MKHRIAAPTFALVLSALPAVADDAADMAALSKSAFLEQHATLYIEALDVQYELLGRLDPELAEQAFKTGPITDEERDLLSCAYDKAAEAGVLEGLALQALSARDIRKMAEDDPTLDFVDFMMKTQELLPQLEDIPTEAMVAMTKCDSTAITGKRMSFSAEFWEVLGAAAEERGYNE